MLFLSVVFAAGFYACVRAYRCLRACVHPGMHSVLKNIRRAGTLAHTHVPRMPSTHRRPQITRSVSPGIRMLVAGMHAALQNTSPVRTGRHAVLQNTSLVRAHARVTHAKHAQPLTNNAISEPVATRRVKCITRVAGMHAAWQNTSPVRAHARVTHAKHAQTLTNNAFSEPVATRW